MNKLGQKVETLDQDIDTMMTMQMTTKLNKGDEVQKLDILAVGFMGRLVKEDGTLEELPFQGGVAPYMLIKRFDNGQFLPGFEEGMKGMKVGETRLVTITFPKNYVQHLADKKATFEVVVIAGWRLDETLSQIDNSVQALFKAKAEKDEAAKALTQEVVEAAALAASKNAEQNA
jgi:FKBP-type peptidyl-prolyl cis-trans isomerase (trigger factor)